MVMDTMEGFMKIVPYNINLFEQTMKCLEFLYGSELVKNTKYIKWKYHDNPYTEKPLGIIAMHDGEVIGFRGYMALKWQVNGREFKLLCAGDTVVKPEHRRKGLSVRMGYRAFEEYESEYKAILNFSGGTNSHPGYYKLGFVPLLDKIDMYLQKEEVPKEQPEISNQPNVNTVTEPNKISLVQDDKFHNWRFKNPRHEYKFYYHGQDFILVSKKDTGVRTILDYSENSIKNFNTILQHITGEKWYYWLYIKKYSNSKRVRKSLNDFGFQEKKNITNPILVRPTKKDYSEEDWFIEGLDIRNPENWKLREVCSDNE